MAQISKNINVKESLREHRTLMIPLLYFGTTEYRIICWQMCMTFVISDSNNYFKKVIHFNLLASHIKR